MKRLLATLLLSATSMGAFADTQCFANKYDSYIDASLGWYEDLAKLTTDRITSYNVCYTKLLR